MSTFVDPSKAPAGVQDMLEKFIPGIEYIENLKSPRVIKTHLPLYLLHPMLLDTCKVLKAPYYIELNVIMLVNQVVYVARNPKDVIVSYYHHHKLIPMMNFTGNMDEFAEYFMKDLSKFALSLRFSIQLNLICLSLACTVLSSRDRSLVKASSSEFIVFIL